MDSRIEIACRDLGVRIEWEPLAHYRQGCTLGGRRIVLNTALGEGVWARYTAAHELGHVFHGHLETTPLAERQADQYAARLLIRDAEYAAAEAESSSPLYIARALDVPLDLIRVYQDMNEWRCRRAS